MKARARIGSISPQEKRVSVLPSGVTNIALLVAAMLAGVGALAGDRAGALALVLYCLVNGLYIIHFHLVLIPSTRFRPAHTWLYAALQGLSLGGIAQLLPADMDVLLMGSMILSAISVSIVADRRPAYLLIGLTSLLIAAARSFAPAQDGTTLSLVGAPVIAVVVAEAVQQLRSLAERNLRRLELINEFNRQITSSLDTNQVLSLLNATVENALEADTYYVGMVDGDSIKMSLLYDDGEYFYDIHAPLEGSLSGWVVRNRTELFLPDLRNEVELPGVRSVTIGKNRSSLSWVGVPVLGSNVTGVLAIASYRPNAFDRNDLELLNNMAQHAAMALDNTLRHAEVAEQTRLDSLTGTYNHGYFLDLLERQSSDSRQLRQPLSLIMLDVDYFKQYNDSYGHVAGDELLVVLCQMIRKYIKKSDSVGRWGGEEFAISLPGADGPQAFQVATRIRETLASLQLKISGRADVPAPTVSQGIAQFPIEADGIMKLIDLADDRLYTAKQRGRNQVEPDAGHWDRLADSGVSPPGG
jgi:diguanylate cyclase (GGDEF)-like protein